MLRRGQRFALLGTVYRVAYVNASRAHCLPVERVTRTFVDGRTGRVVEVQATGRPIDISPNSIVEWLTGRRKDRA